MGGPSHPPCPICGTVNTATLRFCAKCGFFFERPDTRRTAQTARVPWWRRWFNRRSKAERAARAAYRRSLPLRYRVVRTIGAITLLAVVGGTLYAARTNPVAWTKNRWADVVDATEPVAGMTAAVEPAEAAEVEFPPDDAVDANLATAWRTAWASEGVPATGCAAPKRAAVLVISFPVSVELRAVKVVVGGPVDAPVGNEHWRPSELALQFSDGTCQVVAPADVADEQTFELEPVNTDEVRVAIVSANAPVTPGGAEVAITEVVPMRRTSY